MGLRRKRKRDKKVTVFIIAAVAVSSLLVVMICFITHVALKAQEMRGAYRENVSPAPTALPDSEDAMITTSSSDHIGRDQQVRTASAVHIGYRGHMI